MEGQEAACLRDVVGLGLLRLPVVVGSSVYPVAEAFDGSGDLGSEWR
jgi:hypothetical protein